MKILNKIIKKIPTKIHTIQYCKDCPSVIKVDGILWCMELETWLNESASVYTAVGSMGKKCPYYLPKCLDCKELTYHSENDKDYYTCPILSAQLTYNIANVYSCPLFSPASY